MTRKTHTSRLLGSSILLGLMSGVSWAGELKVVRVSKEELRAASNPEFIQATDLSDTLAAKLKLIAVTVTQRQAGSNVATHSVAASAPQISKANWMRRLSTLSVDPDAPAARGDTDKLRVTLSQQSRKATEVKFKEAFPVFEQLKKGLNFKLDLLNPKASLPAGKSIPEIRYGLVETDILPSGKSIPLASLGDATELDARYASPAKVIYTIDKIESSPSRNVFPETAIVDSSPQSTSVWSKAPSANVDIRIDAADQEAVVSDQVGKGAIPGARVTMTQADGFISTQFVMAGKPAKETMVTELKAPLYGEMSLARKYNHKMQTTQTSALNILGDSSLPRVNIMYANLDKKVKGEWIVKKDRFEYNITAEPRQGFGSGGENKLGKVGDKISFGLNTNF